MGEKAQVHVQVVADTKEEWKDYAEEHPEIDNGSLSRLVRMAVRKEIHSDDGTPHGQSGDGETTVDVDLSSVEDRQAETTNELVKLRDTVENMDTRLEEVRRAVTADAEKRPLEDRLWEALPPAKPESKQWRRVRPDPLDYPDWRRDVDWETAWSGKLGEICKRVGEKPDTVATKLDEMGVPREEIDGETRYWMEGQI